jgi:FkbM family methyltransferase
MRKILKSIFLKFLILMDKNFVTKDFGENTFKVYFNNFIHRRAILKFPGREQDFHQKLNNLVHDIDLLIDVGANIGLYVLEFASLESRKIIAIEPDPSNYEILRKNIIENQLNVNCETRNIAIGGENKSETVRYDNSGTGNATPVQAADGAEVMSFVSLDTLLNEYSGLYGDIGIMMDVEGFEAQIIHSNLKLPKNLKFIAIELHQRQLRTFNSDILKIINLLKKLNFELDWLRVPEKGKDMHGQSHAIFLRVE